MAFAARSNTIPTRITTALTAHVMGKTCVKTTLVFLVRQQLSVCPTIASMVFAATTFA